MSRTSDHTTVGHIIQFRATMPYDLLRIPNEVKFAFPMIHEDIDITEHTF